MIEPDIAELPDDREQLWNALVLGLRDYVEKNGFASVILGLSGGIDSSVCAALAADAIGADRVHGVSMPSRCSSDGSRADADDLAANIGLHYTIEPIAELVAPIENQLLLTGTAAENLQARIRGIILMGLSNLNGHLVLTTGNKTELAVGYSTIYGDSAGGFAPIKDVPKMLVWELARWRNAQAVARGETPPIPENSITKPPSAELRPDQTDQDTLPPYELLDAHPRRLRHPPPRPRRHRRARLRRGDRRVRDPARRSRRMEAPAGCDRAEDLGDGVRSRPAPADHLSPGSVASAFVG